MSSKKNLAQLTPYQTANFCSRFIHHWLSPLLKKSHQQGALHLTDLHDPPSDLQSTQWTDQLEANWFDEVRQNPTNPSLVRATWRTTGWKPLFLGFLEILDGFVRIIQPLFLTYLMNFFEPCSTMLVWQACLLAIGTSFAVLLSSAIFNEYMYRMELYGARMRIAYMGLIFRKLLRVSSRSLNSLSSGEITNLFANDCKRIEGTVQFFNYLWIVPLQTLAIIYLFWYFIRYIALVAIGYTIFLFLIQPVYSRCSVSIRTVILKITDQRVKIMSEILNSICIIKMYCWESAFVQRIRLIRKKEICQYISLAGCECMLLLLFFNYITVTFLFTYGTMWWLDFRFDTRFFAVACCILGFVRIYVIEFFATAIREVSYYLPARNRIEKFLLLDESERDDRLLSVSNIDLQSKDNIGSNSPSTEVICHLNNAQWNQEDTFALKNIVFEAQPGDLICVIGPVGSGKSSLLQTLTGEIAYFDGKVRLRGSFCYVPQEAWIFSSTIKNNILFGQEYDEKLFQSVLRATALDEDLCDLPCGVHTNVGDQGLMLSGGQKARVNMARALYRNADIYLLDDPLSAVDVKVSRHLFQKAIKKYLHDKISILVTHQIQFLKEATKIIVVDNGEMVASGTFVELLRASKSFARLLEDIHQHEEEIRTNLQKKQSMIDLNQDEIIPDEESSALLTHVDTKHEGYVGWPVYASYIRAGLGSLVGFAFVLLLFTVQQGVCMYSRWWLAAWSDDESYRHGVFHNCTSTNVTTMNRIRAMDDVTWNAHRNRRFYFFCLLVAILLFLTFCRSFVAKMMCLNAGRVLHNQMLHRIIRSPMSFFHYNPLGRILNRFTSDVSIMDELLTLNIPDFLECGFEVLGTILLVSFLNPWAFLPAVIGFCITLVLRHRFARCSRDLKRLEGATRTPVFSYLNSTINGLKVIRSYQVEQMCSEEFLRHVDNYTRVNFITLTTNRWASIRFDWILFLFIFLVTTLSLFVRIYQHSLSTADIALTLSYSLNLIGVFQWTVRQSVQVDSEMTAVERVLEYCSLSQEPPAQVLSQNRPPAQWPSQGRIVFDGVSMSYSTDDDASLALHNITLTIEDGEKIGIVGRTGAGKTSFIQTLFRLGNLIDGKIIIDNINIDEIGLDDLRSRLSIIPQDPVLFTGTMRINLDPFSQYSDDEIWNVLEQIQLKNLVNNVMSDGLDSMIKESGSNLSVGQKQLVCLTRAILKKSKILVIDEATANVDHETDELIQKAIRTQFKSCTVLTVAHRLRTIIDNDRIIVLGQGELLEFDTPCALLSDPNSHFFSLIEQSGQAEANYLRSLVIKEDKNVQIGRESVDIVEELPLVILDSKSILV